MFGASMRHVIYEDAVKESAGDDFAVGAGEGETQTSVRVGRKKRSASHTLTLAMMSSPSGSALVVNHTWIPT
jgi:hypothetical protein